MRSSLNKNRRSGFTLIEILIVVIILAILAALILPRFLGQTENAYIAEANQQLGALARAQDTWKQIQGLSTGTEPANGSNVTVCPTNATTDCNAAAKTTWNVIGLTPPKFGKTHYSYTCGGTTCTATKLDTPANTITFDYSTSKYTGCAGQYQLIGNATATESERGCRAKT